MSFSIIKKTIFLGLLGFSLLFVLEACVKCGPFEPTFFQIHSVQLKVVDHNSFAALPDSGTHSHSFLRIAIETDSISEFRASLPSKISAFTQAFACDPPPPRSKNRLIGLRLYSNDSLALKNQTFVPPGTDLSPYFLPDGFISSSDKGWENWQKYMDQNWLPNYSSIHILRLRLDLNHRPDQGFHPFSLWAELDWSDGSSMTTNTLQFILSS
ncbi:MAG: hypothetical protein ACK417_02670 [Bacteroidia bacterium]